jgi:transposase
MTSPIPLPGSAQSPTPVRSFVLGIDIASLSFTARLLHQGEPVGQAAEFSNTSAGYHQLVKWLQKQEADAAQTHLVMEATGVYWEECALFLHSQNFAVSVINPAQIKAFARTTLSRAKTDVTDADLIARFAYHLRPALWQPPALELEALQLIMRQRDAYLSMLTEEKNRLHALERRPQVPRRVLQTTKQHIAFLQRHIQNLEDSFKKDLKQYPQWQESLDLLQQIPGIGFVAAATFLTETAALGSFVQSRQLTAYAGIAPAPYCSGSSVKRPSSISKIGNSRLRRAFYMAALSSVRVSSSPFSAFYHRLREKGKPPKVALVAVARKLLVLCFAIVRSQRPFDPAYGAG